MAHLPHVYFPQVYVIPVLMPVLLGVLLPLDVPPTARLTPEPQYLPLNKQNSLFLGLTSLVRRSFNCPAGSPTSSGFQNGIYCLRQPAPSSGHESGSDNMAHLPHVYFPQVYVIPVLMPVLLGVLLPLDVPPTARLTPEPQYLPLNKQNSLFLGLTSLRLRHQAQIIARMAGATPPVGWDRRRDSPVSLANVCVT
ncbi:hypothetical protein MRX96_004384 [Rhipicephalus microplus]